MESFKFVQDIDVAEIPLEKDDIYERYVYSNENPYPVDLKYEMSGTAKIERYEIRTLCQSFRDPVTNEVTTEEVKFAVANSVWEKLGLLPDYIDSLERVRRAAQQDANKFKHFWMEAEDEYRKYLYAPLWQRIKYLFKGYL